MKCSIGQQDDCLTNTLFIESKLFIQPNPAVLYSVRNKNVYCYVKNIFNSFLLYFVVPNILGYNKMFTNGLNIGLLGRVFANGPGDLGSISSRVIPKTLKMVLDTSLLNTQQYKIRIKSKVEQSRERSSALPYSSV